MVRGELRDLDGKYERNERIPAAPCPYTVALLGVAWTTDLEHNYFTGVTLKQAILDANMGCWDGGTALIALPSVLGSLTVG